MNQNLFLQNYRKFLKENFNSDRAEKEKAYLYSGLNHYGIAVWQRSCFAKKYKNWFLSLTKTQAINLVKLLWKKPSFEERSMALHLLNLHSDKLTIKDIFLIEKLMRESKGWAFLDSLIIPIMPLVLTKDKSAYQYLKKWIKDNDFWVRRSALLAQLLFFRNGRGGNRKLFLDMAKEQFDENWIDEIYPNHLERKRARFFIRKAIGWSLREMSHKNPKVVYQFIKENKDKMSGLTFREGSRKLPASLKNFLG